MSVILLILLPLLPFILALFYLYRHQDWLLPLAPLMAFACAIFLPIDTTAQLDWLLLGLQWQLDATAQQFLLFSSLIWLLGSFYLMGKSDPQTNRSVYRFLFLLAFAGNLILIIAAESISFYLGFALMGLSSYGLILNASQQSRRAARVYLGYTLVGELALFIAMLLMFHNQGSLLFADIDISLLSPVTTGLLILGFGIKLALPGLHLWLPLSYTTAPLITAAVLSGPMMKAGLLGWMRFIPAGADHLYNWGIFLISAGISGLILGSLLALPQRNPRAVLAYSSIAKMGFIAAVFGYALANPNQYSTVIAVLVVFAMHHLMVKSALFLSLENIRRFPTQKRWLLGTALVSASLIGLPYSAGATVKLQLQQVLSGDLGIILLISAISSTLMLGRFLYLLYRQHTETTTVATLQSNRFPCYLWWLMLPVFYFAPFTPFAVDFDIKSLLIIIASSILLLWINSLFNPRQRLPRLLQPGDFYHLLSRLRWNTPIRWHATQKLLSRGDWPNSRPAEISVQEQQALAQPGATWLILLALIFISLIFVSS